MLGRKALRGSRLTNPKRGAFNRVYKSPNAARVVVIASVVCRLLLVATVVCVDWLKDPFF